MSENITPEETVSKLIKMFVPTSRALQIEVKSGRAITNTNYWMSSVLKNCLHYTHAMIYSNEETSEYDHWLEVKLLLENRLDQHIEEPHDKSLKLTTPENRHGTGL